MLRGYLVVAAGGAFGSVLRFAMSGSIDEHWGGSFPVGTLAVNVFGCLLIGFIASLTDVDGHFWFGPITRQFLMIGILGGYTTFSSFGLQAFNLAMDRQWFYAGLYVLLSFVLCLVAVWVGWMMAQAVNLWR